MSVRHASVPHEHEPSDQQAHFHRTSSRCSASSSIPRSGRRLLSRPPIQRHTGQMRPSTPRPRERLLLESTKSRLSDIFRRHQPRRVPRSPRRSTVPPRSRIVLHSLRPTPDFLSTSYCRIIVSAHDGSPYARAVAADDRNNCRR